MATPFSTAVDTAEAEVLTYIGVGLGAVAAVGAAGLGLKWLRRIFSKI